MQMKYRKKNVKQDQKYHLICFSSGEIEAAYSCGFHKFDTITYLNEQPTLVIKLCLNFLGLKYRKLYRKKIYAAMIIFTCLISRSQLLLPVNLIRRRSIRLLFKAFPNRIVFVNDSPAPRINVPAMNCNGARVACHLEDIPSYENAIIDTIEHDHFKEKILKTFTANDAAHRNCLFLTKSIPDSDREKVVEYLVKLSRPVLVKVHPRDDYVYWSKACERYHYLSITDAYWVDLLRSSSLVIGIHSSIAYYCGILKIPYCELICTHKFEEWDIKVGKRWEDFVSEFVVLG